MTNALEEFKHLDGEVVTFRIGKVEIVSSLGAAFISRLDINNGFVGSGDAVANIARLLKTLDTDNNPGNGITLPPTIAGLPSTLDIIDSSAVETALGQALVSVTDAMDHLNGSVTALPPRSVEGVYQRVAIGSISAAGCPNVINAEITVSRDTSGNRSYEGNISLSGGGAIYLYWW